MSGCCRSCRRWRSCSPRRRTKVSARVESVIDDDVHAIYFRNPRNNFVQGWAFVTTSIHAEFAETSRRRFLGHESRDPYLPYMVEHGHPDAGRAGA